MLVQLNPPIPIETPKGKGVAVMVIDYGPEFDLYWVCFQDETRECWTFSNQDIRAQANMTMHRPARPRNPVTALDKFRSQN
ncbi:MAG: hypothetical protein KF681_00985 [Bdellovibrionaceae bacterium]|nr:hypothetical protein [Pseudobdellovibrionaceae bacterium]